MSFAGWVVFATFWVVFVTTPGPNAVNCIQNGMTYGFRRSLWGVAAILTQAALFLGLSAAGITALIAASPEVFNWVRMAGAIVLIALGVRNWRQAGRAPNLRAGSGTSIYGRAFLIATINAKSLAGYLAAFSQFVEPGVPIWSQMIAIAPTALCITALVYCGYTTIGVLMGKAAMGAVFNLWFRRGMGALFIAYGLLLGGLGQRIEVA